MTPIKAEREHYRMFGDDRFGCTGRVHPTEYDWREQFHLLALKVLATAEIIRTIDAAKVLGLAAYADELERQLAEAQTALHASASLNADLDKQLAEAKTRIAMLQPYLDAASAAGIVFSVGKDGVKAEYDPTTAAVLHGLHLEDLEDRAARKETK